MQDKGNTSVPIRVLHSRTFDAWLEQLDSQARCWVQANDFTGVTASHCLIPDSRGGLAQVICGVDEHPDTWSIAQLAKQLPQGKYHLTDIADAGLRRRLALGFQLATYSFGRYRKVKSNWPMLSTGNTDDDALNQSITRAVFQVRDLVNTPTEDLGPSELGASLRAMADEFGGRFEMIEGAGLLEQNLPAIHAVGRAAEQSPKLLQLDWGADGDPLVALVGKGVCFDSGGLDIKSAVGMRLMKKDMGGGAHVLALARLIMQAKLPVRLLVLIPAVENSVSGNAYRPGDVISTRQGLSIEIGNTDAEGRLVLADALWYTQDRFKPRLVVDLATLTGAIIVALGSSHAGLFSNDDALSGQLTAAGQEVGEPVWRLPLGRDYDKLINCDVADMKNISGGRGAGSITAAQFLQRFVKDGTPWAHLDIAGVTWSSKVQPTVPKGGTAFGVRLLDELVARNYEA